jgi:hypothetical protein
MCSDKASRSWEITLSNSSGSVVAMAFAIKWLIRSSKRFETKTKLLQRNVERVRGGPRISHP